LAGNAFRGAIKGNLIAQKRLLLACLVKASETLDFIGVENFGSPFRASSSFSDF
jgi:hypothetical protein